MTATLTYAEKAHRNRVRTMANAAAEIIGQRHHNRHDEDAAPVTADDVKRIARRAAEGWSGGAAARVEPGVYQAWGNGSFSVRLQARPDTDLVNVELRYSIDGSERSAFTPFIFVPAQNAGDLIHAWLSAEAHLAALTA